jgi:hypothetical protein
MTGRTEQLSIKRSLLNLSHLIDNLTGDFQGVGLHWRSFKLTHVLKPSFTKNYLIIASHTTAMKADLPCASVAFLSLERVCGSVR